MGKPAGVRVAVASGAGEDKGSLLERVLLEAGFWDDLARARNAVQIPARRFQILIKPDLDVFGLSPPTGTDPELVERLVDLLHDRGFTSVALAEGRNLQDRWLENRDPLIVPDLAGYHFVTPRGRSYAIIDLRDDLVPAKKFGAGSPLRLASLNRQWASAHYRIIFGKNKTDQALSYALGLYNLLGVLPAGNDGRGYRAQLDPAEVVCDLVRAYPIHFTIIDAIVSNHGNAGGGTPRPLRTDTLIASADVLLADWAGAAKMGTDPYTSPLNAKALRTLGLPGSYEVVGDLTPYPLWIRVHPLLADSVRKRNRSAILRGAFEPLLQAVDTEAFPFKDAVNARLNAILSRTGPGLDENPLVFLATLGLNSAMALALDGIDAFNVLCRKSGIRRRVVHLETDPQSYRSDDFDDVEPFLRPIEQLVQHAPADRNGLRWRYVDGAVLFEFAQTFPFPFSEFVARVDIARAIQFMYDYIGGATAAVSRDSNSRVTRQVERNIYLPQPNWMVLFGGKPIDVEKLERIRYSDREHKISWRTVRSANASADYDDGSVTFTRTDVGQTCVRIVARQKFILPLFWQIVNIDRLPAVKDALVAHAYAAFFSRTMSNFRAGAEGRDFRIGRPEDRPGEAESEQSAADLIAAAVDALGKLFGGKTPDGLRNYVSGLFKRSTPPEHQVDSQGFRHFPGLGPMPHASQNSRSSEAFPASTLPALEEMRSFIGGLAEAIRKDIRLVGRTRVVERGSPS